MRVSEPDLLDLVGAAHGCNPVLRD
jgi:hypothetical protein